MTDSVQDAGPIQQADIRAVRAAEPLTRIPGVQPLTALAELADQPPLIGLCLLTLGAAAVKRDPRLARAGARMLAAELLATAVKAVVKASVDRTRPKLLLEDGRYELKRGDRNEGPTNSFPSGHSAGAIAVTRAAAREYPSLRTSGNLATAFVAAAQLPRAKHYPTDVAAGLAIGFACELAVNFGANRLAAQVEK